MNFRINHLIKKYEKIYSGNPWYGDSIANVLKKIDPKIVFSKVDKKSHSIAELLAHIIGWREISLNNLNGNAGLLMKQKETFNWKRFDENEKSAWKKLLYEFDKNQKSIISFLHNKNDDFLDKPVPNKKFNMEFLIEGIMQHDIYHLGQIAILNRILNK